MWSSGEHILLRYGPGVDDVPAGTPRFLGCRPVTVVEDGPDFLVTWLAPGTETAYPRFADGRELRSVPLHERFSLAKVSVRGTWQGAGIVKIFPRDAAHSVWLFWHETGEFWGWYVNLEQRHRRWARGLDSRDHVLDLTCERPREWGWKDEDEFAAAVQYGRFTPREAADVRAEGERVGALIEAWAPPFCDGWENWRAPAEWTTPRLPEDWDVA